MIFERETDIQWLSELRIGMPLLLVFSIKTVQKGFTPLLLHIRVWRCRPSPGSLAARA